MPTPEWTPSGTDGVVVRAHTAGTRGTNAATVGHPTGCERDTGAAPWTRRGVPFYSSRGPRTAAGVDGTTRRPLARKTRHATATSHHHTPQSSVGGGPATCGCHRQPIARLRVRALGRVSGRLERAQAVLIVTEAPPGPQPVLVAAGPSQGRGQDGGGRQHNEYRATWGERARARELAPPTTYVCASQGPRLGPHSEGSVGPPRTSLVGGRRAPPRPAWCLTHTVAGFAPPAGGPTNGGEPRAGQPAATFRPPRAGVVPVGPCQTSVTVRFVGRGCFFVLTAIPKAAARSSVRQSVRGGHASYRRPLAGGTVARFRGAGVGISAQTTTQSGKGGRWLIVRPPEGAR